MDESQIQGSEHLVLNGARHQPPAGERLDESEPRVEGDAAAVEQDLVHERRCVGNNRRLVRLLEQVHLPAQEHRYCHKLNWGILSNQDSARSTTLVESQDDSRRRSHAG